VLESAIIATRPDKALNWHSISAAVAARRLGTDLDAGLTIGAAARRIASDGPNEIRERGRRSLFAMAVSQLSDFMIVILIVAALVSGIIGDITDTLVIIAILVLNGAIGFLQDFRAERAIAALKRIAAAKATVVRGGRRHTMPRRRL
jgi:Ca2+-transporting ATPase